MDPESTDRLTEHRSAIYRYIRGIVRDATVAEDLVQETLLRAHEKLTTLENPASLIPWLYRIATNICHDRYRAAAYRHKVVPLDAGTHGAEGADDTSPANTLTDASPRLDTVMEQREMSACVQDFLAELSDSYRAVILLHDTQGLTNPEIAEMLGVSLATVKIRLHRARNKLRAALAEACAFSTDERGVLVCERKPPKSDR
ncbi:MAG: RNA polymerase sigma factor [Acidobacteriota bacterium]|nr:MAG: RNA polymerase sigma factor [Acidobacteriota bacterium]